MRTLHHEEFNSGIITIRNYLESDAYEFSRGHGWDEFSGRYRNRSDPIESLDRCRRVGSEVPPPLGSGRADTSQHACEA